MVDEFEQEWLDQLAHVGPLLGAHGQKRDLEDSELHPSTLPGSLKTIVLLWILSTTDQMILWREEND